MDARRELAQLVVLARFGREKTQAALLPPAVLQVPPCSCRGWVIVSSVVYSRDGYLRVSAVVA